MRNFDSLYHFAENGWTAEAQSHGDPVFGTLLTSFFINTLGFSAAAAGIASSITTAISAGGGYMEFRR
jgi:hypothetical protein